MGINSNTLLDANQSTEQASVEQVSNDYLVWYYKGLLEERIGKYLDSFFSCSRAVKLRSDFLDAVDCYTRTQNYVEETVMPKIREVQFLVQRCQEIGEGVVTSPGGLSATCVNEVN